jgi:hypothetical protein
MIEDEFSKFRDMGEPFISMESTLACCNGCGIDILRRTNA